MKIVFISDTHRQKPKLPKGELLIHCGDLTSRGTPNEIEESLQWLKDVGKDFLYGVILIPGNHDFGFERNPHEMRRLCNKYGIILLIEQAEEINGVKIWGSPWTPWFHSWAYNAHRGDEIKKHWELIPSDTNILITHGPPAGILDLTTRGEPVGCVDLLNRLRKLKDLKIHAFGHIHEAHGHEWRNNVLFINASVLDEKYCGFNTIFTVNYPSLTIEEFENESK